MAFYKKVRSIVSQYTNHFKQRLWKRGERFMFWICFFFYRRECYLSMFFHTCIQLVQCYHTVIQFNPKKNALKFIVKMLSMKKIFWQKNENNDYICDLDILDIYSKNIKRCYFIWFYSNFTKFLVNYFSSVFEKTNVSEHLPQ